MPFEINVEAQKQPNENDCWATCASMVLKFSGYDKTVEDVTAIANEQHINGYQLGQMGTIAEAGWVIKKLSDKAAGLESIKDSRSELEWDMGKFKEVLEASKPIMIFMHNHMMLVIGYDGDTLLRIIDPASGSKGSMKFSDLQKNLVEASVLK
jgi:ABC-type bacteriocin/lantibiotic exporter with double-glycine peptidase domain